MQIHICKQNIIRSIIHNGPLGSIRQGLPKSSLSAPRPFAAVPMPPSWSLPAPPIHLFLPIHLSATMTLPLIRTSSHTPAPVGQRPVPVNPPSWEDLLGRR